MSKYHRMPISSRPLLALLCIFWLLSASAQSESLSKKQLKEIRKELVALAEQGENYRVINNVYLLMQHGVELKAIEIDLWLDASYQNDNYHEAMRCLFYCDSALLVTPKLKKKLSEQTLTRFKALELSRHTHDKYAVLDTAYIMDLSLERTDKIIAALPEFSYWKIVRADVLARQGLSYEALGIYQKYRQKYQEYPQYTRQLAGVYFDVGKFDSSLYYLKLLESELMDDSHYQLMRAYCHLELFEFEEALYYYKKLDENEELNRVALINKFFCADMAGDSAEAFNTRVQLMALDSNDMTFVAEAYALSISLNGYEKSRTLAVKWVNMHPQNVNFRMFRVQHYKPKDIDDFEPMLKDVSVWSKFNPKNILPHLWVAWFVLEGERSPERRKIARNALSRAYAIDSFDLRIYEYGCRIHMWPEREVAREFKNKGIRNMTTYYREISPTGHGAYQVAMIYSYPDNGYSNKRSHRDSMLAYLNLSLQMGMDSFTVLQKRHDMHSKETRDRAIADKWWLIKHTDSSWYQRNLYWGIINLYEMQDRYQEAKELILFIRDYYGDNRTLQWRLRSVNRELRKKGL